MPEQQKVHLKGGTMRLGAYPCRVKDGTILHSAYQTDLVFERHRHRYEFNNAFRAAFEAQGAVFSGLSPDGDLVEAMELPGERFSVGVQFHPEFKSRPTRAHPLFRAFLKAALQKRRSGH
jgi:CTP synthase